MSPERHGFSQKLCCKSFNVLELSGVAAIRYGPVAVQCQDLVFKPLKIEKASGQRIYKFIPEVEFLQDTLSW